MANKLSRTKLRKLITAAIKISNNHRDRTSCEDQSAIIKVLLTKSLEDVPAEEMRKVLLGPIEKGWETE